MRNAARAGGVLSHVRGPCVPCQQPASKLPMQQILLTDPIRQSPFQSAEGPYDALAAPFSAIEEWLETVRDSGLRGRGIGRPCTANSTVRSGHGNQIPPSCPRRRTGQFRTAPSSNGSPQRLEGALLLPGARLHRDLLRRRQPRPGGIPAYGRNPRSNRWATTSRLRLGL